MKYLILLLLATLLMGCPPSVEYPCKPVQNEPPLYMQQLFQNLIKENSFTIFSDNKAIRDCLIVVKIIPREIGIYGGDSVSLGKVVGKIYRNSIYHKDYFIDFESGTEHASDCDKKVTDFARVKFNLYNDEEQFGFLTFHNSEFKFGTSGLSASLTKIDSFYIGDLLITNVLEIRHGNIYYYFSTENGIVRVIENEKKLNILK